MEKLSKKLLLTERGEAMIPASVVVFILLAVAVSLIMLIIVLALVGCPPLFR